ncbi:MAG: glycosyltransferase [Acidimicrobiales bacterium]
MASRYSPSDLTVALCTIGRPGYLEAAITSLLDTTPPGTRFHLVLNGCEAGTTERLAPLIEQWDGPTEVTVLDERVSIHESHSTALDGATTPLITFMGDDDLVLEPRIPTLLARFDEEPEPLVVGSFARRAGGTPDEPVLLGRKDLGPTTIDEWRQWVDEARFFELCFPAAIINSAAARAVGGFDPDFGPVMDVGLFTRLADRGPVIVDPDRGFGYRIHDQSMSTADGHAVAERYRYVEAAIGASRADRPVPTFEEFRADEAAASPVARFSREQRVRSQLHFRQAGSAMLGGRRVAAAGHLAKSAVSWPPVFGAKVRGQFGRRSRSGAGGPLPVLSSTPLQEAGDDAVAELDDGAPVATVLIKGLYNYRVAFYQHLRRQLADQGVRLRLLHGQGSHEDRAKGDVVALTWSEFRRLRTLPVGSREVLWQPGLADARRSDLVVCEQASRLLLNYPLMFGRRLLGTRLALWGHGRNLRAGRESAVGEWLKRFLTNRADWFFAYNDLGVRQVESLGFPADRITSVQNSSDTTDLAAAMDAVTDADLEDCRRQLGLGTGPVGLFMGGLYDLKRPDFLIESAEIIRRHRPDFELIVIGDGPEADRVRAAAEAHSWVHFIGPTFGADRARYASLSSLFLLPGLVGLNVVDAFALELPVVTVDLPFHAPEIEYVVDGENALVLPEGTDPAAYAAAVHELLAAPERLEQLREGCRRSAMRLSVEEMARRFAQGVLDALDAP